MALTLGTKAVGVAGTRERLSSTHIIVSWVCVQVKIGNTGKVYVGDEQVTSTLNLTLQPPQTNQVLPYIQIPPIPQAGGANTFDLYNLWLDAAVNGEGVNFLYDVD